MANAVYWTRTNYFRVTDEERYQYLLAGIEKACGEVEDACQERHGIKYHAFLVEDDLDYLETDSDPEPGEYNVDYLLDEFQKIIPPDEALLIKTIGHEKFCYLIGSVYIVTTQNIEYVEIGDAGKEKAREMLGNPNWDTEQNY